MYKNRAIAAISLVLISLVGFTAIDATASNTVATPQQKQVSRPLVDSGAEANALAAAYAQAAQQEIDRLAAEEAARIAAEEEAARQQAAQQQSYKSASAHISTECGNEVLPDTIVQRESRGQCDAFNATGCNGRGCIGYAQLDQGHFAEVSPWNPNVPGTCYGLTYNECVAKLFNDPNNDHWK